MVSSRSSPPELSNDQHKIEKNDKVILVLGRTGTGKSSFIQLATAKEVAVGHRLRSCTTAVGAFAIPLEGCHLVLVDTPGFGDTYNSDADTLLSIATWLEELYHRDVKLTGIVYLHPISDNRMTGSSTKNLELLHAICGPAASPNICLVTTMWDRVEHSLGARREEELIQDFWRDFLREDAQIARFDRTPDSAIAIAVSLMTNTPVVLDLQRALVDQKIPIMETAAGKLVMKDLASTADTHKASLETIAEEQRKAAEAHQKEMLEALEKVRMSLEQRLHASEETIRRLEAANERQKSETARSQSASPEQWIPVLKTLATVIQCGFETYAKYRKHAASANAEKRREVLGLIGNLAPTIGSTAAAIFGPR